VNRVQLKKIAPRIVYIAGWGRSGTTLVGGTLESTAEAVYIGELWNLWEDYDTPNEHCSCGKPYRECDFWKRIVRACEINDDDISRLKSIKARRLGTRSLMWGTRRLAKSKDDVELTYYKEMTARVYEEVAELTGHYSIVDASKTPNLIYLMSYLCPRVLHIVRDPRAVAYSWWFRPKSTTNQTNAGIMARHNPARSTIGWLGRNTAIERAKKRSGAEILTLTYEDFVGSYDNAISSIWEFTGLAPRSSATPVSHSIRGNPSRFAPDGLKISADHEWADQMPVWMSLLVTAMAGPLMLKYGYLKGHVQSGSEQ